MKRFASIGITLLGLSALPLGPAAGLSSAFNDWVVVPKVRVGPIGNYTSVQALRSLMPNAVLRHQVDRNGAKTTIRYRTTNLDQNIADMIIRWRRKHRTIKQIIIFRYSGPWRMVMGIRMNTSIDSVSQVNGARIPLQWRKNFLHAKSFPGGKISQHFEFAFRQPAGSSTEPRQPMPSFLHSDHPLVRGKNFRIIGIVIIFP